LWHDRHGCPDLLITSPGMTAQDLGQLRKSRCFFATHCNYSKPFASLVSPCHGSFIEQN
jgi:hypothetical protein